jgi:hypothetical protein
MDSIASALNPIATIAWGEIAMGFVGVGLSTMFVWCQFHPQYRRSEADISKSYMIAIEDSEFDAAVDALHDAGFRDAPWSYGSTVDPQYFKDKKLQEIHRHAALGYRNLDNNSKRLVFPPGSGVRERAVLLRCSYVHLSFSSTPQARFSRVENLHYPDAELLLESFVRMRIREPDIGLWTSELEVWAVSYLWGQPCSTTVHWIRVLMSKLRRDSMIIFGDIAAGLTGRQLQRG